MPGILPMKVIKVGLNAQSRIAQACDRCRSKKIRCDGVRPCCSQCANVGFECKTSDKLSRRAFPRGYTESLEERVRGLECEVRELKDLLDEKDEKIDMLSRIHSQSSRPIQMPSPRRTSTTSVASDTGMSDLAERDEVFKVQQSPHLLTGTADGAEPYFTGTSSSRTFIEAFKHKVQESGRSTADVNTELLLGTTSRRMSDASLAPPPAVVWSAPPRLLSDQLVNIFFQEWAPLFPVLHRPTFLALYEKYVADADAVTDKTAVAQLNLVFGIAALSNGTRASDDLVSFETQWKAAIDSILTENTMATLQALVLAQIFCVQQGDLTRLLTYKGLSTSLSARLGLHQSQKRFALGTLTCETRKKVFWTLYTVDSFTAVALGLPKHLKDDDVQCEYPVDADDEYVTERGFQPTLPGESTKLSSALALFRAARILSKVLEEVFPAKNSYELSLRRLSELSDELDAWNTSLAPHLRLQFVQDKPSTGTISSRSPLLSLTYHYIRALIQRPAICASLGSRSSSFMLALAGSCKHIVQIVQLLDERGMAFSFCLNKDELLVLSGFGLLFQGLKLDSASKMLKDNQKMVNAIVDILTRATAPCAQEFSRVARSFLPAPSSPPVLAKPMISPLAKVKAPSLVRHQSENATIINPIASLPASTRKQLKAIASRFTAGASSKAPRLDMAADHRRATLPSISLHPHGVASQSQPSLHSPSKYNPASMSRSEPARSPLNTYSQPPPPSIPRPSAPPQPQTPLQSKTKPPTPRLPNLDYLSFGNDVIFQHHTTTTYPSATSEAVKTEPTDWEKLLGSLDNGTTNIYDACYGGPPVSALLDSPGGFSTTHHHSTTLTDSSTAAAAWNADLWALCQTDTNTSSTSTSTHLTTDTGYGNGDGGHPDSIFSFSTDDGRSSAGDFDWGSASSAGDGDVYRGIVMPAELSSHAGGVEVGEELKFGGASWDAGLDL